MKRILKRIGRWLGLIERRWWDDLDCSPVIMIEGQMLAAALERRIPSHQGTTHLVDRTLKGVVQPLNREQK